jgi:hypothetical protein
VSSILAGLFRRHFWDVRKSAPDPGGTGNPYFTTDTTAVLCAAEMGCDAVLKATEVDGVYTADPKRDPSAKRHDHLDHQEALDRNLKIMVRRPSRLPGRTVRRRPVCLSTRVIVEILPPPPHMGGHLVDKDDVTVKRFRYLLDSLHDVTGVDP